MPASASVDVAAPPAARRRAIPAGARGFCLVWLGSLLLLATAVGAFDALIDPYLVIGAPRIVGLNAQKPETGTHTQLAKRYLVARVRPAGLLLGTSKVDIGIDPDSPLWPDDSRPAFNDGVPGIRVGDDLASLRARLALGTVRRVFVMLQLEDFLAPPADAPAAVPAAGTLFARAHDVLLATLSTDAFRASLATVAAQGGRDVLDMSPHGATSDAAFRGAAARDGYDTLFLQKDHTIATQLARVAARAAAHGHALVQLDLVADIIALCRARHIPLDMAISPSHADYLDGLDRAGLWTEYQQAKAALTALVAAQGDDSVRLWDFSFYDAYATEAVPRDRRASTHWFWEPNHFKRALGEKILATIYHGDDTFGTRLTPATLAAHLAAETAAKAAYQAHDTASRDRLARAMQ